MFLGEAWCCVNISSDVTTEGKIPAVGEGQAVLIRENALRVCLFDSKYTILRGEEGAEIQ